VPSVTVAVPVRVETPGQVPVTAPVWFTWTDEDPWAVTITFAPDRVWGLARQLLADGLTSVCGEGDVTFTPGTGSEVVMTLSGGYYDDDVQTADIHLPKGQIWAFLGRTFDIIAPGLESIPDAEYDSLLEDV
jgi:hypothetical protein